MVWRLTLPHLGAICSVVSYHVEPPILEMLAHLLFVAGEWEDEGVGLPL